MPAVPGVVVVVAAAVLPGRNARGSVTPYYGGTVRIAVVHLRAVTAAVPPFMAIAEFTALHPSAYGLIWGLAFSALLVVNFLPAFRRLS